MKRFNLEKYKAGAPVVCRSPLLQFLMLETFPGTPYMVAVVREQAIEKAFLYDKDGRIYGYPTLHPADILMANTVHTVYVNTRLYESKGVVVSNYFNDIISASQAVIFWNLYNAKDGDSFKWVDKARPFEIIEE